MSSHAVDGVIQATCDYDDNGNREDPPGAPDARQYDAQDRLLAFDGVSYTHNVQGQRLTETDDATGDLTALDYDAAGNLMAVDLPDGARVEYETDGHDRRVLKRVFDQNGQFVYSWTYIYDGHLHPEALLETNADGTGHVMFFTYGSRGHAPDTMVREGRIYRLITDHLGSIRLVVDVADGTVVERLDYDPWGAALSHTVNGQVVDRAFQPFGFAGGLYDTETALVRFGARDYDPTTGRWLAKDPIRFDGGDSNIYAYVGNDPVNWLDPEGLQGVASTDTVPGQAAMSQLAKEAGWSTGAAAAAAAGTVAGEALPPGWFDEVCQEVRDAIRHALEQARPLPIPMGRPKERPCKCPHRDIFTSDEQSCLDLRLSGICKTPGRRDNAPIYRGVGRSQATCQADARVRAPVQCRGCLGHCGFSY